MPINKYRDRDLDKLRRLVSIDSAMFMPELDYILGVKDHSKLYGSDGLFAMPLSIHSDTRGMHSTLAMAMALDAVKKSHMGHAICHIGYEPMLYDHISIERHHPSWSDTKYDASPIGELIVDRVNAFKLPYLTIDSFIGDDDDLWSIQSYDEEKLKLHKIPSKDRLDMLSRIYKTIKGNKK